MGGPEYPATGAVWDGLRARLRQGAAEADVLAYLRWCATQPWERDTVRFDPEVLFREKRFEAGLAKARASPAAPPRANALPEVCVPDRTPEDWEAEEERLDARRWWERLPRDERDRVEDEATKRAVERWGSTHQSCIDRVLVEMRREREEARP
jgi:hypothetical protein